MHWKNSRYTPLIGANPASRPYASPKMWNHKHCRTPYTRSHTSRCVARIIKIPIPYLRQPNHWHGHAANDVAGEILLFIFRNPLERWKEIFEAIVDASFHQLLLVRRGGNESVFVNFILSEQRSIYYDSGGWGIDQLCLFTNRHLNIKEPLISNRTANLYVIGKIYQFIFEVFWSCLKFFRSFLRNYETLELWN